MSNYTQAISFGAKDVLTSTDPAKIILGANVDSELALIATAITSKLNTSDLAGNYTISGNITFTGTNVIPAAGLTGTVVDARLSANVPLINAANSWSASQLPDTNGSRNLGDTTHRWGTVYAAGLYDGTNNLIDSTGTTVRVGSGAGWTAAQIGAGMSAANVSIAGVASSDFARLSQANTFAAVQTIAVADSAMGLNVKGATGSLRIFGYLAGGVYLDSINAAASANLPMQLKGSTLVLVTTGTATNADVTLNGVAASDFARLSQSNTFTLANKFSGVSIGSILLEDLASPADEKLWRIFSSGSQFGVQSRTDANGAGANTITASRTGTTVTTLAMAATAITLNGRDFGTSTLPALSGVNLTSLNASNLGSGTVPDARFPATLPALNGSALTTLSASNISSGALADARLSANIPLLNAANTFTNGTQKISITSGNAQFEVKTTDAAGQPELKITNSTNSWSAYMPAGTSNLRFHDGGNDRLSIANGGNFDFKGGTVTTNNASASEVGYKGLPQNSQSVSYTTVLADCNKNLHQTGATKTFTIDSNANVAAPIGTVLNFTCDNATGVSIAITTDTLRLAGTATTGTRTLAQYGVASAIKILSTTWLISGQGLS